MSRPFKIIIPAFIIILIGGVSFFIWNLPSATYDQWNPFAPKPPKEAFPAAIADYKLSRSPIYSSSYSNICQCNYYSSTYRKADQEIAYTLYAFKTAEAATAYLKRGGFVASSYRTLQDSDVRMTWLDGITRRPFIALVAGTNLITIASWKPADALAFENQLPYSVFGVVSPAMHTADELAEKPIEALSLLNEVMSAPAAARKKYQDKYFSFTGIIAAAGQAKNGKPFIALQKPGEKVGLDSVLSCTFRNSEVERVLHLKTGDNVQFRGKPNMNNPIGIPIIEDCTFEKNP